MIPSVVTILDRHSYRSVSFLVYRVEYRNWNSSTMSNYIYDSHADSISCIYLKGASQGGNRAVIVKIVTLQIWMSLIREQWTYQEQNETQSLCAGFSYSSALNWHRFLCGRTRVTYFNVTHHSYSYSTHNRITQVVDFVKSQSLCTFRSENL